MDIRVLLGVIGLCVVLCPTPAWPRDATACRERCGNQAERIFTTCIQKGRGLEPCEAGAHDGFAACVAARCARSAEESCSVRCDSLGAEVRAHCLEESRVLAQCEDLGEAARGQCAAEQC